MSFVLRQTNNAEDNEVSEGHEGAEWFKGRREDQLYKNV